ncbi:hypothetical protein CYMTET_32639 [Cymbomonas tetramitiformis]|uniref:Reverse transcriptase Ty1/copia-type domain-containing protein n=1 Tax=Cymbomonas tetramitiformis TaxID=36881 RepID=A0AAE0FEN2_9CHLO|nr:hypothetical protein CYMTET_32639 [Cymbomonas tetramitiformis]
MVKGERSKSPNPPPSYGEPEPELKPGESSTFEADELATHKQQITALMDMVKNLTGNLAILQQAHLNAAVPVDMSDMSLSDAQNESVWLEWRAKIAPSLRHPSLALLLSEGLVKLRRNTSLPYFITQLETLISQAGQSGTLAPPLQMFLDGKGTLQRIREYASVASVMPSGKSICLETLECIFTARVLVHLHPDYLYIKTKFVDNSLPTLDCLTDQVSSHYDTIVAPHAAATQYANAAIDQSAGAIADDRRKQEELKRRQLAKKVPCPQCHRLGHVTQQCFMTNVEKRDEFCRKATPEAKAAILKRVAEYEKHGKLPAPGESLGAVAGQSDMCPGLEHSGEALFALTTWTANPDMNDVGESSHVLRVGGQSELHPGLAEMGDKVFESMSTHVVVCSDAEHSGLTDTDVTPFELSYGGGSNRPALLDTSFPAVATFNYYSILDGVCEPAVPVPAGDGSSSTTRGSRGSLLEDLGRKWVYIDIITAFFPTRARLEKTQSVWESGRVRHLGHGYRISPRQFWFTSGVHRVHTNMVTFSERLHKMGKIVITWDPSVVAPLKTNLMATALDAPYRDPVPDLLETPVLEQGVYLQEGDDEVMAVVKVETSDGECRGNTVPAEQDSMLPAGATEPKNYSQVLTAPDVVEWLESIQNELEALVQIKRALLMMKEEDVPPGVKLLDMSLVLKLSSVRIVIALALNLGLVGYHMDVDTAFLNSVLDEDLYVQLPRGLEYGGCRCAKLLKAMYGLKQAGKEWFDPSDAFIMGYGSKMQRSEVEPCMYFIKDVDIMVIILAYANDYLVATDDKTWYDTFVTQFHSRYSCRDMGTLDLVMGIGKSVSLSTTEAEIIALSEGAREIKYILNVLDSLVNIHRPVPMYCDNQGAIHLASNYVNSSRSKHIDVRNMYIRELMKAKDAEALYTGTDDNTSDVMTKSLALPSFRVHRERLGVMDLDRDDR